MEDDMRITVRGWGRDLGETELTNASLADARGASDDNGRLSRGNLYKSILYPEHRSLAGVRIATSAEMRLGGTYLLAVELSRKEIAQLFYETHSGEMVRMVRSFIEEEDRAELLALHERRRKRWAEAEQSETPGSGG
jgi:hypothetical protein